MRAYARVNDKNATIYIPETWNRVSMQIEWSAGGREPGWYRASAVYDGGWYVEIGAKVEPAKEAARLRRLAERGRDREARTHSPGIMGFMHMERMSTEAIRTQTQISKYFANLLGSVTER